MSERRERVTRRDGHRGANCGGVITSPEYLLAGKCDKQYVFDSAIGPG